MAPARWKGAVKDVESIAWADLNSDHFPLEVTMQVKLGRSRQAERDRPPQYDFTALPDEARQALDGP